MAAALLCCTALACSAADTEACKPCPTPAQSVIGWVEKVRLLDAGIEQSARIDTGAGLSSLAAAIVEILKADPPSRSERVVFAIGDGKGGSKTLSKDIVDWVEIKKKGAPGTMRRPVVAMTVCLAGKTIAGRVNLAERDGYIYPLLIGRNMLATAGFLVDSQTRFMHEPVCAETLPPAALNGR